jgi:hypothetical protein
MKRPLFQKKKNSAGKFGGIINKHSDFFRLLDCPISFLPVVRSFFIFLKLSALYINAQTRT